MAGPCLLACTLLKLFVDGGAQILLIERKRRVSVAGHTVHRGEEILGVRIYRRRRRIVHYGIVLDSLAVVVCQSVRLGNLVGYVRIVRLAVLVGIQVRCGFVVAELEGFVGICYLCLDAVSERCKCHDCGEEEKVLMFHNQILFCSILGVCILIQMIGHGIALRLTRWLRTRR